MFSFFNLIVLIQLWCTHMPVVGKIQRWCVTCHCAIKYHCHNSKLIFITLYPMNLMKVTSASELNQCDQVEWPKNMVYKACKDGGTIYLKSLIHPIFWSANDAKCHCCGFTVFVRNLVSQSGPSMSACRICAKNLTSQKLVASEYFLVLVSHFSIHALQ